MLHFLHLSLPVAGVEYGVGHRVELAVLVDANAGLAVSTSGKDMVVVTLIDSPPVGAVVLKGEAGQVITEEEVLVLRELAVVLFVKLHVEAMLLEGRSCFFERLQAPH